MNCKPCEDRKRTSKAEIDVAGEPWCYPCFYGGDMNLVKKARSGEMKEFVPRPKASRKPKRPSKIDPYRERGARAALIDKLIAEKRIRVDYIDDHDRRYFHQAAYIRKLKLKMTVEGEWLYIAVKQ